MHPGPSLELCRSIAEGVCPISPTIHIIKEDNCGCLLEGLSVCVCVCSVLGRLHLEQLSSLENFFFFWGGGPPKELSIVNVDQKDHFICLFRPGSFVPAHYFITK